MWVYLQQRHRLNETVSHSWMCFILCDSALSLRTARLLLTLMDVSFTADTVQGLQSWHVTCFRISGVQTEGMHWMQHLKLSQLVKPWGPTVENRGRQVKNYDELLGVKDKTKTRNEEVNTGKQMKQRRVRGSNEGMRCRWRHWELGGANEDDVKQVWEGKSDWGGAQVRRRKWRGSISTK